MTEDKVPEDKAGLRTVQDVDVAGDGTDQFDERIRASLTRRAEAVRVKPDLDGLVNRAGSRRATNPRLHLLAAAAIVIAALAVASVALRPDRLRDSHVITRAGNSPDRSEEKSSASDPTSSTSSPKSETDDKGASLSTTTTSSVPTTVAPPGNTTPPPDDGSDGGVGGGDTGDDGGSDPVQPPPPQPSEPPPPRCDPVENEFLVSVSWGAEVVYVVQFDRDASYRYVTLWRDPGDLGCPEQVLDSGGQPFVFHLDVPLPEAQLEVHNFGCDLPRIEVVNGRTYDGAVWYITVDTYELNGNQATRVDAQELELSVAEHHDRIESLRQTRCDG